MTVETALYPNQLNASWPAQSDIVREGAGHIRAVKTVLKTTFPNVTGAVTPTHVELNYMVGVTSPLQAQINSKGDIAGQTWTGTHVFSGTAAVPTLAQGTNTTGAASTAFVQAEWATRLPNYTAPITSSSTELNHLVGVTSGVQSQINAKGAIAGQTWTGTHSFPSTTTVGPLTPTIQGYLSTATSDVQAQINSKAAKAGDTYTGAHNFASAAISVPTLAPGSSGNSAASVDYANALAFASALPAQTGNSGKFITTNGVTASWSDTIDGNLNFTGAGRRITGDFSNALASARLAFKTNVPNSQTTVEYCPSGSGNNASLHLRNYDIDAGSIGNLLQVICTSSAYIGPTPIGGAAPIPLVLRANGDRLTIDPVTGNILSMGGTLGYGVGAGGTVVQSPNNTSSVPLNKPNGIITLANGSIAAGARITFQLQNSLIGIDSTVIAHGMFDGVAPVVAQFTVQVEYVQAGFAYISVKNNSGSSVPTDNVKIRFAVFAGSAS